MNFFSKIFSKTKKNDAGPMPTRPLNFQFELIPENGPSLAGQFRSAVKQNENIDLDYSVGTLEFVDNFLQRFKDKGITVNNFAETIFVAGCYTGQVMANNNNGRWIKQEDAELPDGVTMMPIVIRLPDGTICDPIAKAYKRFHYGQSNSIAYFYQVMTKSN